MTVRKPYQPTCLHQDFSTKNEPFSAIHVDFNDISILHYPDMHSAYENARKLLGIADDYDFILSNGCENAIKNVLLALRPSNIVYSVPTWEMIHVIACQLNLHEHVYPFKYDAAANCLYENIDTTKHYSVHYCTYFSNNFYATKMTDCINAKYTIVDCSYTNPLGITAKLKSILAENVILVGGFQKTFGCGIRLGYAIFNKVLSEKIQLQRENYINSIAAHLLMTAKAKDYLDCIDKNNSYQTALERQLQTVKNNFFINQQFLTLVDFDYNTNVCKRFSADGHVFSRFGVAYDDIARNALLKHCNAN